MKKSEKEIKYQRLLEHFETLDRYNYSVKKFLVTEIERILVDIVGFDKEIVFSEPIKEFDKIRINDTGAMLHYNSTDCREGWITLDVFFNISVINGILSELRIYAIKNL